MTSQTIYTQEAGIKDDKLNLISISVAQDGSGVVFAIDNTNTIYFRTSKPWENIISPNLNYTPVSIGVCDDGVWLVDSSCSFYQYVEEIQDWKQLNSLPVGNFLQGVSATSSSQIWGWDSNGIIYQYNMQTDTWTRLALQKFMCNWISSSVDATWAVDLVGNVYSYDLANSTWTQVQSPEPLSMLSVGAEGYVWGIGKKEGILYQYDGSADNWAQRKGFYKLISVGDDATVWGIGLDSIVYSYDLVNDEPVPVSGTPPNLYIALSDKLHVWGIDANYQMYEYNPDNEIWKPYADVNDEVVGLKAVQISAPSINDVWFVTSDGSLYNFILSSGNIQSQKISTNAMWCSALSATPYDIIFGILPGEIVQFILPDGTWNSIPSNGNLTQVTIGNSSLVFAIDTQGNFFQVSASGCTQLSSVAGGLANISIGSDGTLLGIDKNHNIWAYMGEPNGWTMLSAYQVQQISVGDLSNIWGIGLDGSPVNLVEQNIPGYHVENLDWDTESPTDENRSTHLWIARRGFVVAYMANTQVTGDLYKLFLNQDFYIPLCQGLYDADMKGPYNDPILGLRPTWKSHFYDPDTGKNYFGETEPTALTRGMNYFDLSVSAYQNGDLETAAYNLGLSLHYLTDLTQPMHAANFTAWSTGVWYAAYSYHSAFESYAMEIQNTGIIPANYTPNNLGVNANPYLIAAAQKSKAYMPQLCPDWIVNNWKGTLTDQAKQQIDALIPNLLCDAINITSQYLVAWGTAVSLGA